MKQIVSNYSYSPTTNVVTLTGVNIDADQLLLIVAPEVGRTMYNFASVTGTVSAGADTRVTLNASTVGLTTISPLVIFYDDQLSTQTIAGTVTATVREGEDAIIYEPGSGYTSIRASSHWLSDSAGELKMTSENNPLPISGTVTANVGNLPLATSPNDWETIGDQIGSGLNAAGLNVDVASLPAISGTVTANNPNGALTTRFGSVTTAGTAELTSAVTNASRKYLLVQNIASSTVTIGIGFAPTTTQGIQLSAGGGLTFDAFCPTGAVYWLSSVTGSNWSILDG